MKETDTPDGNVSFETLKVGDLIAVDMDCFIMGDAQCVVSITETEILCELYHMGERFPYSNYDARIKREDIGWYWTRGETLESWRLRIEERKKQKL